MKTYSSHFAFIEMADIDLDNLDVPIYRIIHVPSVPRPFDRLVRVFTPMLVSFRVNSELQAFRRRLSSRKIEFRCDCNAFHCRFISISSWKNFDGLNWNFSGCRRFDSASSFLSFSLSLNRENIFLQIGNSMNPFLKFTRSCIT